MSPAFDPSSSAAAVRPAARGRPFTWIHVVRGEPDAAPTAPSSSPPPIPRPELADRPPPPGPAADSAASPSAAACRPFPPPPEGTEHWSSGNAAGKMLAWNVPTNGGSERGAVMGADSWPALSESTKAAPKSASSEPSTALANGSKPAPLVSVIATPRPKTNSNNPNPSSNPSLAVPARQKPNPKPNTMRSGGGSSSVSLANGAPASPQPSPTSEETTSAGLDVGVKPSPKDHNKGNNNWDRSWGGGFMPQHHGGGDHRGGYNGNRRGNNRGGGSQPHDRERGGYEWNASRGFHGRDPHMPMPMAPQRGYPRPFMRPPPPPPAPFIGVPQQVRAFVGPMGFPEVPPVYYVPAPPPPPIDPLRNVPFVAHQVPPVMAPAVFLNPVDHQRAMLVKQIEYYFSNDNLCKDTFLREKMDDQGWVPISLIAGFNRVKQLTNNIPFILDTVRGSTVVEVQGERIRRRNDWMNWILPPTLKQYGIASLPQSPATSGHDSLATHVQNLGLDKGAPSQNNFQGQSHTEVILSRSSSGNVNDQLPLGDPVKKEMGKFQAMQNQIDPSQ